MKKPISVFLALILTLSILGGVWADAAVVPGSVVQMLQAEDAVITGKCQVMQNYFTASRLACVGKVDDVNSTVTFRLEAPEAGTYLIQLCTGSGSDQVNAGYRYWTNGQEDQAQIVRFKNYGWETWRLYDVYVELDKGRNTFTVSHTGEQKSFTQIDFIKYWSFPTPAAQLTAGDEAFASLDIQQKEYYYLADGAGLPELGCRLTAYQDKYDVAVEQPAGLNQAGSVTLSAKSNPQASFTYTVWFCDQQHYMARFSEDGSTVVQLEAEDGELAGGAAVRGSREGSYLNATCSGNQWVSGIENTDASVTFTLAAPADGEYLVKLCLDSFSSQTNPGMRYWVNGDEGTARQSSFAIPREFQYGDSWYLFPIYVDLKAGENTLTLSHDGGESSTCELDYIRFFTCPVPDASITLDGRPLEGFSRDKWTYDVRVTGDALPLLGYEGDGLDALYDIAVTQPAGLNQAGRVVFAAKGSPGHTFTYNVNFYDENAAGSLVINDGGDPWVTYHDGYYYYINTQGGAFLISKSKDLTTLNSDPVNVYTPDAAKGEPTREIWAPELHYIRGEWYIYYAAYHEGGSNANHRCYVLKGTSQNPQDPFVFVGQLKDSTDKWMIDTTILEVEDELYAVWSGWERNVDGEQALYIAHMDTPTHIDSERVMISYPEEEFERLSTNPYVNEGPAALIAPDGTVNVVYTANHFSNGAHYRLALLTLKDGADPMDADNWIKSEDAVFASNPEKGIYSVGHPSFTTSPDGTESYILYHGRDGSASRYKRRVYLQSFGWNEDGTPCFDKPLGSSALIKAPSGTAVIPTRRIEAESGTLGGGASTASGDQRYVSGGLKVTGLGNAGAKVTFTVEAPSDGAYALALYAAQDSDKRYQSGLKVTVNQSEGFHKQVIGRGVNAFYWYNLSVPLKKGSNTITIEKSDSYAYGAELDCIRLSTMSEEDYAAGPPVEPSVTLDQTDLVLKIGETALLTAAVEPEGDRAVWSSDNENVASVDQTGLVTALAPGSAVITVTTAGGASASCTLTVYLPGDMNNNGSVAIDDVMEACKVLARKSAGKTPTADEMLRGNLDGDEAFTITDVMEICKILARRA